MVTFVWLTWSRLNCGKCYTSCWINCLKCFSVRLCYAVSLSWCDLHNQLFYYTILYCMHTSVELTTATSVHCFICLLAPHKYKQPSIMTNALIMSTYSGHYFQGIHTYYPEFTVYITLIPQNFWVTALEKSSYLLTLFRTTRLGWWRTWWETKWNKNVKC